ncbi:MAG: hypothetical protein J2P50_18390 [Hyphomicrobiaceae bacterium]|nr:hypothetical protein [Hyphomicrobiaceae bacterium]
MSDIRQLEDQIWADIEAAIEDAVKMGGKREWLVKAAEAYFDMVMGRPRRNRRGVEGVPQQAPRPR